LGAAGKVEAEADGAEERKAEEGEEAVEDQGQAREEFADDRGVNGAGLGRGFGRGVHGLFPTTAEKAVQVQLLVRAMIETPGRAKLVPGGVR
jgi:hypothetical protein